MTEHSEADNNCPPEQPALDVAESWGFPLEELYKIAIKFFKDNESKAFHPSYNDRNHLMALVLHVKHGAFLESKAHPLGSFDIIGRDRRQAWSDLKSLCKEEAMSKFIVLLDKLCSTFKPFVEAHKREKDDKERKRVLEEENLKRIEQQRIEEEMRLKNASKKEELKKLAIQQELNRQTYQQFAAYAQQQYPSNVEQQEILIKQLQEQHYQQYIQQMLQHQLKNQNRTAVNNFSGPESPLLNNQGDGLPSYQSTEKPETTNSVSHENFVSHDKTEGEEEEEATEDEECSDEETGPIASAQMWTRKDIKVFKETIRKDSSDGIIKVGHGEIVTVRVPTHPDGTCIFWEFATDSFDIGFGLLFEWTKNPGSQVSVHISESEDEDEDEEDEDAVEKSSETGNDVERGRVDDKAAGDEASSPCSVIIPIYRRDCHEEVYAGSHTYPGKGIYLLKFDNSYSLWRSKTLYYRVYYTR
ncbi:Protein TMED8-like protein [Leptotrombidium deliense]|uniref:Protein TMED8-like protein n=1 Tax=Leptotrombidium deliense TaxID=299467 RepID=A0A443SNF1_9ACAR|nr:Protein TMED8-like protein [Leptotrombidium deliense]